MTEFTELVARQKAWIIFLAIIGPIVACQIYLTSSMPAPGTEPETFQSADFAAMVRGVILGTLLMLTLLIGWLVSAGKAANRRIDAPGRPTFMPVSAAAVYVLGYMVASLYLWPALMAGELAPSMIVVPHLLSVVAMFSLLVLVARNVAIAEKQAGLSTGSSAGLFFAAWFFPIGIWFIQPRVNRLVAGVPTAA